MVILTSAPVSRTLSAAADAVERLNTDEITSIQLLRVLIETAPGHDIAESALNAFVAYLQAQGALSGWAELTVSTVDRAEAAEQLRAAAEQLAVTR